MLTSNGAIFSNLESLLRHRQAVNEEALFHYSGIHDGRRKGNKERNKEVIFRGSEQCCVDSRVGAGVNEMWEEIEYLI